MTQRSIGKYRLLAELGHGGMADVFLAVVAGPLGSGFSKLTVIKRLRQHLADEPEFVKMLMDEARISARLNHPNVVQTNEVGHEDGEYFIAMEYLDGQPLHRVLQRRTAKNGSTQITKEMEYLALVDALAGLHHAHDLADYDGTPLEIVHRDVTPHNIFVTYDGQVKVVDFGIAKAAGRSSETREGLVKGKVRYMSPEQAIGLPLDRTADVFAIGVMLWESATGRRAWHDMDDNQIVQSLLTGDIPRSPRAVDPTVPEPIDRICQKALARRAPERYATAEDLRIDLEQYLADSNGLVEARRKLGPTVAAAFADKRADMKQIIERQLTAKDTETFPRISLELTGPRPMGLASSPQAAGDEAETKIALAEHPSVAPKEIRRSRVLVTSAGALAIVVAAGWALASRPKSAGVATSPAEVHVSLRAQPPTAVIKIDDRLVGNLFDARLPRDGTEHRIEVAAEGFAPRVETIRFDAEVVRSFDLERKPSAVELPAQKPISVHLAASPPYATLSLDGRELVGNPYEELVPADGKEHELVVAAKGYKPLLRKIGLGSDVSLTLKLERLDAPTTAHAGPHPQDPAPSHNPSPKPSGTHGLDWKDPW